MHSIFYLASEADSRSNRRSRRWTVEAATLDDAVCAVRTRHAMIVGGNSGVYVSVIAEPTSTDRTRQAIQA